MSCEKTDTSQAPEIHFGRDVCDVCGMIISDERYAAALWVREAPGEERPMRFDDVGEMLQWQREHGEGLPISSFVWTYDTRLWLPAESAIYVHSAEMQTPMAFGIAACSTREEAQALAEAHTGQIQTYEDAVEQVAQPDQ